MGEAILWVGARLDGCWWYRMELPRRYLAAQGYDVRMGLGGNDVGHLDDFRATILQRVSYARPEQTTQMLALIRALRHRGARVLYELDDDLWRNNFFKAGGPLPLPRAVRRAVMADTERIIERCDGVIVTSAELAAVVARHNRHVHIIPNAVPVEFCERPRPPGHDTVRIGWVGGMSHGPEGDFARCLPALRRVLEARRVAELVFMGWHPPEVETWPRTKCLTWVPIENYYHHLAMLALDIFIAPLAETRFNASKSASKLLEAGALGLPIIAEPHGPYRGVLEHERTGLYAASTAEWEAALLQLCDEPETRGALGLNVRQHIRAHHTMEQTGPLWAEALGLPLMQPGAVTVGAGEE